MKQKIINFESNIRKLYSMMDKCTICPRKCGANRNIGQKGFCKATDKIFISNSIIYTGEEPPISAKNGSGAIFFSNCTLNCVFCQNYTLSQLGKGKEIDIEDLVSIMLNLQKQGAHNINLVTPTHYSAHIAKAIYIARTKGLTVPTLYNCSGYENVETLKFLEGIIDIYIPDIKYSINKIAFKYSGIKNYVKINQNALIEMKRQVGNLKINHKGIAKKGIIVRHLVLPGNTKNTMKALEFIAKKLSTNTFISLMSQYYPAYKSINFKELSHSLTEKEHKKTLNYLKIFNLKNGWTQNLH
jgi:putative pyruvate formate lyase activating enzyme